MLEERHLTSNLRAVLPNESREDGNHTPEPKENPTVRQVGTPLRSPSKAEVVSAEAEPPHKKLRRTASQAMREAIFGSSDEELSDIESPTPIPHVSHIPENTQPLSRPMLNRTLGRSVLDSDEEGPPPVRSSNKRVLKKKLLDSSEDEIEEVLSPPVPLSISRRPSALRLEPVTPSLRPAEAPPAPERRQKVAYSNETKTKERGPTAPRGRAKDTIANPSSTLRETRAVATTNHLEIAPADSYESERPATNVNGISARVLPSGRAQDREEESSGTIKAEAKQGRWIPFDVSTITQEALQSLSARRPYPPTLHGGP